MNFSTHGWLSGIPVLMVLLGIAAAPASAADADAWARNWPQWRGPTNDGVAPLADPPINWSDSKSIKWKVAIPGRGSATPVVWNDRIFVLSAVRTDRRGTPQAAPKEDKDKREGPGRRGRGESPSEIHQFVVLCLDRAGGKVLWQKTAAESVPHEGIHSTNTYASGSPITDGAHVYAWFGSQGLYCYDFEGNLKWKRDLGDMQTRNAFGEGGSPALQPGGKPGEGTLIVPFDHEGQSFVAALDAKTGDVKWKQDRDEPTTWSTPLIVEHEGKAQAILNGTRRVRSYDLATGELLWQCGGQVTNPIPTPVVDAGIAYVMTGYRGYAVYAIPLSARGDITGSAKIAWSKDDAGPYIASPVLYKGLLYYTKSRDGVLLIADAKTGKALIEPTRLPDLNVLYSSPVAAAGRVYFTSRDGTTVVLAAGTEVKVLATNKLGEAVDASPVLLGKQMLLRGESHLYCIEE